MFTPLTQTRQDKTVLSCLCWRCAQAIKVKTASMAVIVERVNYLHQGDDVFTSISMFICLCVCKLFKAIFMNACRIMDD